MKTTLATIGWEILNHPPYSPAWWYSFVWSNEVAPRRTNFKLMMNWKTLSWTGNTVRIKPFMLLASVTCQDAGGICHHKGRISWAGVRLWLVYFLLFIYLFIFFVTKKVLWEGGQPWSTIIYMTFLFFCYKQGRKFMYSIIVLVHPLWYCLCIFSSWMQTFDLSYK
jgi:hypothetical protein